MLGVIPALQLLVLRVDSIDCLFRGERLVERRQPLLAVEQQMLRIDRVCPCDAGEGLGFEPDVGPAHLEQHYDADRIPERDTGQKA